MCIVKQFNTARISLYVGLLTCKWCFGESFGPFTFQAKVTPPVEYEPISEPYNFFLFFHSTLIARLTENCQCCLMASVICEPYTRL